MIEQIYETQNLITAFKKVKSNKGCPGIDRVSIKQYESNLSQNIREIQIQLKTKSYNPIPVKRVLIPKPNGKQRPLGIPAVRDRLIQQAALQELEPIFEPIFSEASFGFRPKKSPIMAIDKVQKYLNEGYGYVVEADIRDFFGQLSQQRLVSKVKEQVKDKEVLRLIGKFLRAGVMEEGKIKKAVSGTPQGGVISPLLANIYLNDFDHKIERSGLKLVRYADDFVILCKTVNQAVSAMKTVRAIIRKLNLELAEEKTRVVEYYRGFDFLGYHFQRYYGKNMKWPSGKAMKAFKDKIRIKTRRQQPKNVAQIIEELNPVIRGWGNYFRYGNSKTKFTRLDEWIRMRLRSFIKKKKWIAGNSKYPNTHFEKLGLVFLTRLLNYQQKLVFPV